MAPTEREEPFKPLDVVALPFPGTREMIAHLGGRRFLRRLSRARGAQRRAMQRDAAFRIAGRISPMVTVDVDGVRYHLNTADQEISRIVFIFGMYDRPLMHAAFGGLRALGGPADFGGKQLLDVGANIGTTTLTACTYFNAGGAVAFEPDPTNLGFLDLNVRENGLGDRVRVYPAAVSDRSATLQLERSPTNAGDHRIQHGDVTPAAGDDVVAVKAVALDELVSSGELDLADVGAIWLDIQGHEAQALAGAIQVLEAGLPIVVEYWPAGLRAASGLEPLKGLIGEHYSRFCDLGRPGEVPDLVPRPVAELDRIDETYAGLDDHTDLLLVPPALGT